MSSPWFLLASRKTMNAAAEQHHQNGLLHVQAVFRLVEYNGSRRIDHGISNFFATVRWQTMHEQSRWRGSGEELVVHLICAESLFPLCRFTLLAHTGPGVGVDRVGAGDGLMCIAKNLNGCAGRGGDLLRLLHDLRVGTIAFGGRHP